MMLTYHDYAVTNIFISPGRDRATTLVDFSPRIGVDTITSFNVNSSLRVVSGRPCVRRRHHDRPA